jgi:hypothetical protein
MQKWLWLPLIVTAAMLLIVIFWTTFRPVGDSVLATYAGAVELGGSVSRGRVTYWIVQWVGDPANPQPCPLVIHLPEGDLGGDALCDWGSPATAERLGGPVELDVFPFHKDGKVVGIRVGLLPGCPPIEMSSAGKRFTLPLPEESAVRLLGEPTRRALYDSSGRLRP